MSALRVHRVQVVLWAGFALLVPGIGAACSVCMTGRDDETRLAFELMTAFMTVMPFILAGGVFYWLRGRMRELEAMHERARAVSQADALAKRSSASPVLIE
jgi:hypothetical protein